MFLQNEREHYQYYTIQAHVGTSSLCMYTNCTSMLVLLTHLIEAVLWIGNVLVTKQLPIFANPEKRYFDP
jgi:hypothetical protein